MMNRNLFCMWDGAIRCGYGAGRAGKDRKDGTDYVSKFLPRVQKRANFAVAQLATKEACSKNDAVQRLTCSEHTFVKVLDEFNYMKFTQQADEVWDEELRER